MLSAVGAGLSGLKSSKICLLVLSSSPSALYSRDSPSSLEAKSHVLGPVSYTHLDVYKRQIEECDEADDDYDYEFTDMEIPDSVKPKKISIHIFRTLSLAYIKNKGVNLVNRVLSQMNVEQEVITEELHQIESVVSILENPSTPDKTEEDWKGIWSVLKKCIFHEDFDVSGFEFTSTGLASSITKRITSSTTSRFILAKSFLEVFEDNVERFLEILQSALTRLENFSIVDCGLHDGGGVSSLAKEIRIKLVYDGDASKDNIGNDLSCLLYTSRCV